MIRSVFLKRILGLVLATILVSFTLTASFYFFAAGNIFTQIKAREFKPRAQIIAQMTVEYLDGQFSYTVFDRMLRSNDAGWDARIWVVDSSGQLIISSQPDLSQVFAERFLSAMSSEVEQTLSGEDILFTGNPAGFSESMLAIGIPVRDESDQVIGAVLLAKSMDEIQSAMGDLSKALIMSTLLVLFFMVPVTYLFSLHLAKPIYQMRDVALAMAGGDFSARADTVKKGELGELGASLNHMATELGNNLRAMTVERNRLMQILNGLVEGIVAVDNTGRVTHSNAALLGLFHNERRTTPIPRHLLIPLDSVWRDITAVIRDNQTIERNITYQDIIIHFSASPLADEGNRVAGAVGVFRDVTAHERLEQTRRDYVANVSHELRTPLTSLRGLVEPLKEGLVKSEADKQRYLDIILRETLRLNRLVNDLLELSRLQSGTAAMSRNIFDPYNAIADATEQFISQAEDKQIALELELPDPMPKVFGNPDRVEQILVILIDNAMKYTPTGGTVCVRAVEKPEWLEVSVSDTGVGISTQDLPHVFERLYKVNKARGKTGTGLGLAIAYEVMSGLGEKIWADSEPGKGSRFAFTLHYTQEQPPEA